jgi:hypothetical protein
MATTRGLSSSRGHDPGPQLLKVVAERKRIVLDPLHSQVDDARGKSVSAEEVAEGKHPHGQQGNEHVIIDGLIAIVEFGAVNEEAIDSLAHVVGLVGL